MPIDSSVAELLTAQLFVLVQEAPDPIYFYINSTGIAVRALPLLRALTQPLLPMGFPEIHRPRGAVTCVIH